MTLIILQFDKQHKYLHFRTENILHDLNDFTIKKTQIMNISDMKIFSMTLMFPKYLMTLKKRI